MAGGDMVMYYGAFQRGQVENWAPQPKDLDYCRSLFPGSLGRGVAAQALVYPPPACKRLSLDLTCLKFPFF